MVTGEGFGDRVRAARSQAGWSQEALAVRAGIDRSWLSKLECGRAQPDLDTIIRLHRALRRHVSSLDMLLTGEAGRVEGHVDRRSFLRGSVIVPATLAALPMIADLERMAAYTSLDAALLDDWRAQTVLYAHIRSRENPHTLLPKLDMHWRTLLGANGAGGSSELHRELLTLAAGTSALCAWVALTGERRQEARRYLDMGEQIAREVDAREELALLLMLRADYLSPIPTGGQEGYPVQARRKLDEAISLCPPSTSYTLRVPLICRAAEEAAGLQEEREALDLLDRGQNIAEVAHARNDEMFYLRPIWTGWAVPSFRGSALQLLGQPRQAIETLSEIESDIPNHRPLMIADQAAANVQLGDLDEVARLLADAIDWSFRHGHASAGRRIDGVRRRFPKEWEREPVVRALDERRAATL